MTAMTEASISIQYKPLAEDYQRVLIRYQRARLIIIASVVILIAGSLFMWALNSKPKDPNNDKRPVIYLTTIVVPLFVLGALFWGIRKQAKRIEESAEDSRYTFDELGMDMLNENASASMKWQRFTKVVETKTDFLFFPQEGVFFVTPKRVFQTEDQVSHLKSLLRSCLGDRAKLLG